jgi:hypothetical protein
MPLHSFLINLLTLVGLLFFIINVGIIITFNEKIVPVHRKFLVQYIDTEPVAQLNKTMKLEQTYEGKREIASISYTLHDNLEPIPRPRLSSLVQGWNITRDVSWLIQFSIIGFPKSGTSTLMFHLRDHPEIHMFPHERCELSYNKQVHLIEDMYRQFPPAMNSSHRFVRGIKCPMDLENRKLALSNYQKFFLKTDFIVGIRHPILWYV